MTYPRLRLNFTLLLMIVSGVQPAAVHSAVRTVGLGQDFASIQAAILGSVDGDIIEVYSGTYNENVSIDRSVTIREAAGESAQLSGVRAALSPTNQGDIVITSASQVVWDGIDIVCADTQTQLIRAFGTANVIIRNVTIGESGQQFLIQGILCEDEASLVVENSTINLSLTNPGQGTLITVTDSGQLTLRNCHARSRADRIAHVSWSGLAGVYPTLQFEQCDLSQHVGSNPLTFGPLIVVDYGQLTLRQSRLKIPPRGDTVISLMAGNPEAILIDRCQFDLTGGTNPDYLNRAILVMPASGPGTGTLTVEVDNSHFLANRLQHGAINIYRTCNLSLRNNTFSASSVSQNAGIYAAHPAGQTLFLTLQNNIFNFAAASGTQAGAVVDGANGTIDLTAGINLRYLSQGGVGTNDILNGTILTTDPLLDTDLLHLLPGSPAIDAGLANGLTIDIDGQPRPGGTAIDLGADEFYAPVIPSRARWIQEY